MSRKKAHQVFVETTKKVLLNLLANSKVYPIGNWLNSFTKPDIFIVQSSSSFTGDIKNKENWYGSYDRCYIIECKISIEDIPHAAFQLLMSLNAIGKNRRLRLSSWWVGTSSRIT